MKKVFKNPIFTFLLGAIIFAAVGVTATTLLNGSDIQYTGNKVEGAQNIQQAIDTLYDKANSSIDYSSLNFQISSTNNIVATNFGICMYRNNKLNCFKTNNYNYEKEHVRQVFSDGNCQTGDHKIDCDDGDYQCAIYDDGYVDCIDYISHKGCSVEPDGTIDCD